MCDPDPPINMHQEQDYLIKQGDSLAELKKLADSTFKLIVSSPPYNIGKAYETQVQLPQYLAWQTAIIQELVRLVREDGSIVWQVGNYVDQGEVFPLDIYLYPIFKNLGLQLRNRIIWHFDHGLHASKRFSGRYEVLLWFTKTKDYTFNLDPVRVPAKYPGKRHYKGKKIGQLSGNPRGKNPSDYWTLICQEWEDGIIEIPNVKSNHPEKTIHPCQFPVELIERCVLALTNVGDWVLDPFGGVGSSLIAALNHQRRGLIIDRNQDYLTITQARVEALQAGTLKIRPLGKPIHQPSGQEKIAQIPAEWLKSSPGQAYC
ncbi:site-specific DNA-methyltransferase [Thermosynechococcaceae cyanobacterium BACA0444]|uniref:Methyltransferase n=1 Tax=Pseudocalidococcus azoricus BACA0444 TaxID=2918990 RepID=A0AAE4FTE9_9CYAN|nr:site-specific DNA-methyltransferase [Pseudocalidococcus azoricus]MDS3862009.1 site-specific DNA-methyltransferase [Pseudocalidococcus azoricus BACA0444]